MRLNSGGSARSPKNGLFIKAHRRLVNNSFSWPHERILNVAFHLLFISARYAHSRQTGVSDPARLSSLVLPIQIPRIALMDVPTALFPNPVLGRFDHGSIHVDKGDMGARGPGAADARFAEPTLCRRGETRRRGLARKGECKAPIRFEAASSRPKLSGVTDPGSVQSADSPLKTTVK